MMTEAMKKDMEEAVAWVATLHGEELMKEIAKAKKLVTEKHLLSPRLEKALIADAKGDKRLAAWNVAKAQLFEAHIYRKKHPSENV